MEFTSRLFSYDNLFFSSRQLKLPVGRLFQVSELSVIRGGEIAEHVQCCDEITYAISGKAQIFSDGVCQELCGGQVHFLKKDMTHKIIADINENFRYICIGFIPDTQYPENAAFMNIYENTDRFVTNDDGNVRILSEMLVNEFYMKDDQSNTMINLYMTQILISLFRLLRFGIRDINSRKVSSSSSNFTLYHALRYIDREYIYIKSVKGVAQQLSYSEYYLSHLFKEKMGMTIKEYILRKKLAAAAELLEASNLSISEISEYLNFSSQHTFSEAFKKLFSVNPSSYKKQINSKL